MQDSKSQKHSETGNKSVSIRSIILVLSFIILIFTPNGLLNQTVSIVLLVDTGVEIVKKNKYVSKGMGLLGILCFIGALGKMCTENQVVDGLFICSIYVYHFLLRKRAGRLLKGDTLFTLLFIITAVVRIFLKEPTVIGVMYIMQFLLFLRMMNPYFTKIADMHKDKPKEDNSQVGCIRKFLFGRNGTFEIPRFYVKEE